MATTDILGRWGGVRLEAWRVGTGTAGPSSGELQELARGCRVPSGPWSAELIEERRWEAACEFGQLTAESPESGPSTHPPPKRPRSIGVRRSQRPEEPAASRRTRRDRTRAARNLPKCRGIVLRSEVTRMRCRSAARARTSGSDTPSSLASFAERKSITGSRRLQPLTIASWRLASARKRIIPQLRRDSIWCCRIRSNFSVMAAGAGCAALKASSSLSRWARSLSTSSLLPK